MRTNDIKKLGIDRNFLRQCEKQKLIAPKKTYSEWIIHEEYAPKEYSQKDIEIVWNAYLYRKMGLDYDQIRKIMQGEDVQLRKSLNNLIEKYEEQIAEMQAIIEFMKYVKGIGDLPEMPEITMESQSFREYLTDYMNYIDKDKGIKSVLTVVEKINNVDDLYDMGDEELEDIENMVARSPVMSMDKELSGELGQIYYKLKEIIAEDNQRDTVYALIARIYEIQKEIENDDNLTVYDFVKRYVYFLSQDSDIKYMFEKMLGEREVELYVDALVDYLIKEEPERVKKISTK